MKKRITLITLVFLIPFLSTKAQVVVSNDLFRNLYIGIENPISIMAENIPDYQMGIQVNQGSLKKIGPNKYTWTICSLDKKHVLLKVYQKQILIDSIWFKLIPLPDPNLTITTQDKEIIFKGAMGVRVELENFPVEGIVCKIQKFNITIINIKGDTIAFENHGGGYEEQARKAFNSLKIGDKVILSDFIVIVGCDLNERKLKTVFTQVYSGKEYQFRY